MLPLLEAQMQQTLAAQCCLDQNVALCTCGRFCEHCSVQAGYLHETGVSACAAQVPVARTEKRGADKYMDIW